MDCYLSNEDLISRLEQIELHRQSKQHLLELRPANGILHRDAAVAPPIATNLPGKARLGDVDHFAVCARHDVDEVGEELPGLEHVGRLTHLTLGAELDHLMRICNFRKNNNVIIIRTVANNKTDNITNKSLPSNGRQHGSGPAFRTRRS